MPDTEIGLQIMGILNTTPDSFSDGGRWGTVDRAVAQAERMLTDGADIIDIGGESSRPGADPVDEQEERRRVLPVIQRLAGRCVMSIDTAKPQVAEAALEAGASIVNDITASLEAVAGHFGAGWVAMHMQGEPRRMQHDPRYDDVVAEVRAFLDDAADRGERAGVGQLWLDPGIGFGKTTIHNLDLLRHLPALIELGTPVLVGVSRKRLTGLLHAAADSGEALDFSSLDDYDPVSPDDRLEASIWLAGWSWACGARIVRVHDVGPTAAARDYFRATGHY